MGEKILPAPPLFSSDILTLMRKVTFAVLTVCFPQEPGEMEYKDLKLLNMHYVPNTNLLTERYKLYHINQMKREKISVF